MSKESMEGTVCRCGNRITFQEQHWDHCPEKDNWRPSSKEKKEEKRGRSKRARSSV